MTKKKNKKILVGEEEGVRISGTGDALEGGTGDALPELVKETSVVIMSPEEIESRYQAFLEKIKRGGK